MTVKQEMERQFGRKGLERVVKAGELFDAVDAITEAFQRLQTRVAALENQAGVIEKAKPVFRVKATGRPQ
ncbi:hypothetical protein [Rhizobium beringeri]|uniref:hypothetical protein n=1 Tax=Rhizobium beringeri TaxID=3019934 RepID=UPI002E156556|nr:hypothetical protein U8P75_02535 [Rhizobium beringeri]WSH80691.1 hypothetical protein U8P69_02510 [Rhizobium beringeri]